MSGAPHHILTHSPLPFTNLALPEQTHGDAIPSHELASRAPHHNLPIRSQETKGVVRHRCSYTQATSPGPSLPEAVLTNGQAFVIGVFMVAEKTRSSKRILLEHVSSFVSEENYPR
jgi:hypothetical protein